MAGDDASNKTEKPTPQKRSRAQEAGQFPRSRDAGPVLSTFAVLGIFVVLGPSLVDEVGSFARHCFGQPFDLVRGDTAPVAHRFGRLFALITLPGLVATFAIGVGVTFAQVGLRFEPWRAIPDFDRFDPIARIKGLFSPQAQFVELGLGMAKVAVVAWMTQSTLQEMLPGLLSLGTVSLKVAGAETGRALFALILRASTALAILSAIDYVYSWWKTEMDMMMSREEIKEESKGNEGDPRAKARMKQIGRERVKRQVGKQVAQSDVVVVNPTHVSVALRYRVSEGAPIVTAKGYDEVALYIRELAREAKVEIVQNKPLARGLAARVKVGKPIPADFYGAVAEVLAFVYRLRGHAPKA